MSQEKFSTKIIEACVPAFDFNRWFEVEVNKQLSQKFAASFPVTFTDENQNKLRCHAQHVFNDDVAILLPDGWLPIELVEFLYPSESAKYIFNLDRNTCNKGTCQSLDLKHCTISIGPAVLEGFEQKISYTSFQKEWEKIPIKLLQGNISKAKLALETPLSNPRLSKFFHQLLTRHYPVLIQALEQLFALEKQYQNKAIPQNVAIEGATFFVKKLYQSKIFTEGLLIHAVVGYLAHRVNHNNKYMPYQVNNQTIKTEDPFGRMLKIYSGNQCTGGKLQNFLYNGVSDAHLTMKAMTTQFGQDTYSAFVTKDFDLIGCWASFSSKSMPPGLGETAQLLFDEIEKISRPNHSLIDRLLDYCFTVALKGTLKLLNLYNKTKNDK